MFVGVALPAVELVAVDTAGADCSLLLACLARGLAFETLVLEEGRSGGRNCIIVVAQVGDLVDLRVSRSTFQADVEVDAGVTGVTTLGAGFST